MYERIKRRVYDIVECPAIREGGRGKLDYFDLFIMALIVTNVVAVMVETVKWAAEGYARPLRAFEIFSVVVFTAEYLLRLWSCTADPRYEGAVKGRIKFALTPMALIDLLAIAPFYLEFITIDLRFIRSLRLFRLFRVFKLARYSASMRTLANVLRSKKEELLVTLFVVVVMLVFSSSVMFYAENEAQPDKFDSIPSSMWWGVATLTTVGYGDVFPVTTLGKLFGAVIAILGVGLFALPTGILASGFAEELQKNRKRAARTLCPHCGREINEQ
ncbi:MAG TPA: ion transporter [Pyrinomonadaceae bacterium]|nr:ion transporter [Pyrinomonadaceae bacterium]